MRTNYAEEEVAALIAHYAELRALRDTNRRGLRSLIRVADLDRALEQLPMKFWEVVLLHGLIGLSQDETARLLQITQQAVAKRYRRAIEETAYLINGGT